MALMLLGVGGAAAATTTVEIRPFVAAPDGAPVVDRAWLVARVERANAIFAPYDLQFVLGETRPLAGPTDAMVRADRNALARQVERGVVNLFVVGTLMDIHEPGRIRRGVHWKARHGGARVRCIIMAAYAAEGILAHELAHFFGNPKHRHVPGNLVGYVPGLGLPTLDPDQAQRMRRSLRRSIASGELVPVTGDRRPTSPAPSTPR